VSHPEPVTLRIGLLRLPQLLTDVVRSAFERGEAEFDEVDSPTGVSPRDPVTGVGHDAVIAGAVDAWEQDLVDLKCSQPTLVVFGMRQDGRRTWLYELVPYPRPLGELGLQDLRSSLLAAVQSTTDGHVELGVSTFRAGLEEER
jgi:hypothetical protein